MYSYLGIFKDDILYDVIEPTTSGNPNLKIYSLITIPEELEKTDTAYLEYAKSKLEEYNGVSFDNCIIQKSSTTELDDKTINFIETESFGTQEFSGSELSQYFYDLIDTKGNTVETIILKPGEVEEPEEPQEPELPGESSIFTGGTGTKEDPYLIETATQLEAIRNDLTAFYKLINDIDLTYDTTNENGLFYNDAKGWISIGANDKVFEGSLDGNNKKIIGLNQNKVVNTPNRQDSSGGLFSHVSGEVKDLILENINLNYDSKTSYYNTRIGGLASYLSGTLKNITVSGTIKYTGQEIVPTGGICGYISGGNIINCINYSNVKSESKRYTGGIAGEIYEEGKIINAKNYGNIEGKQGAAGIVEDMGNQSNEICAVSGCINYGSVTADYPGGIVSSMAGNSSISMSSNYGYIIASDLGGGIASLVIFSGMETRGYIKDCLNAGKIYSNGSAGGIVGTSVMEVNNSYNIGEIYLTSNELDNYEFAGGIVGSTGGVSDVNIAVVNSSYNIGKITSLNSNAKIGNIVGNANSDINNCYYLINDYNGVGILNDEFVTGDGKDESKGLTIEQMLNFEEYIGFDFENVWSMNSNETYLFPELNNNLLEGKFINNVEITNTDLDVKKGETLQLNATVNPDNADNKNIIWSVDNVTGEATISETGLVTATKPGKIKVKATAKDLGLIYDEVEINILPISVTSVEIINTDLNIKRGQTLQLNATVNPDNADNKNIIWSIDNVTGEATISETGLVTGIKAGTVKIKVATEENNEIYDETEVVIQPNIISYTSSDISIPYDGRAHSIDLKVDTENVIIKYMDEKGSYTLDNKPEYNKVGEYTISYQITKDNYDTVKASNKLYIYGIKDFDNTIQINNNILKVKDYTFSMQTLYRKFNIFANTVNYNHLNSSKENITDDLLKTGDYIEILINGVKAYTYQISVSGDVNCDGKISALDYVKIKNHIMGTNIIDKEINQTAADANNDEKISALDYVRIKNIIMNGGV